MEEDKEMEKGRLIKELCDLINKRTENFRKWRIEHQAKMLAEAEDTNKYIQEMERLVLEHIMHVIRGKF